MEDIRQHVELMHVLRHSFRPSEPFQAALEPFLQLGSERPPFLFKTLSGLAINASQRLQPIVARGVFDARTAYERSNLNLHISDTVAAGRLGSGALQLFFGLTPDSRENLREVQHTLKAKVPSSEWVVSPPGGDFQLYVTLPYSLALADKEILHEEGLKLRKAIQEAQGTSKFLITSTGIPDTDELHIVQDHYYESEEEAS